MTPRIIRVEAIGLRPLPLRTPFPVAWARIEETAGCVVRIETGDGAVGYGEAVSMPLVTGETVGSIVAAVEYLATTPMNPGLGLVGRPLADLDDAVTISRALSGEGGFALLVGNSSARAGIEGALLDLLARRRNVVPTAVLGVEDRPVRAAYTAAIADIDTTLAVISAELRHRPDLVRIKVGGPGDMARDVALVTEVRALLATADHPIRLAADANAGLTRDQAVEFLTAVEGQLAWCEQPCPGEDLAAFAAVAARVGTPLMADESVHDLAGVRTLAMLGGVALVNVKIAKAGGVLSALRIAAELRTLGLGGYVGSMIESSLGASSARVLALAAADVVQGTDCYSFDLLQSDPWQVLGLDGLVVSGRPLRPVSEMDAVINNRVLDRASGGDDVPRVGSREIVDIG